MLLSVNAVDPTAGLPLYQQIVAALRERVAAGALAPWSVAPSIRELAADLKVNYHTVARAFHLLEAEGVLVRRRGGAYIVADVADATGRTLIAREVDKLVQRATALGLDDAAVLALVREGLARRTT